MHLDEAEGIALAKPLPQHKQDKTDHAFIAPDSGGDFWNQLNNDSPAVLNELHFTLLALDDSNYRSILWSRQKNICTLAGARCSGVD